MHASTARRSEVNVNGPRDRILDLLKDYQHRKGLTDEEMASKLGIDRASWNLLKNGRRGLAKPRILVGFVRLFPRRTKLLAEYLAGETTPDDAATEGDDAA